MSSPHPHQFIREDIFALSNTIELDTDPMASRCPPQKQIVPSLTPTITTPATMSIETVPPRQTSPCLLLLLPAELRNQIYTLLLTSSPTHTKLLRRISIRGHISDYILPSIPLTPALLSTCRQIHSETLGILYGANTFAAHSTLLSSLPYLITPRRPVLRGPGLARIRKWYINIRLDVDARFTAREVEAAFTGAEELEIDVFQAVYGACDIEVLRLFEGVRGVGIARVCGSTAVEEGYGRWLEGVMMMPLGGKEEKDGEGKSGEA